MYVCLYGCMFVWLYVCMCVCVYGCTVVGCAEYDYMDGIVYPCLNQQRGGFKRQNTKIGFSEFLPAGGCYVTLRLR